MGSGGSGNHPVPTRQGTCTRHSIVKHSVERGPCLPTVVPADSRPLSRPTAGAHPRNRLASSATGGASAISPPFRVLIASLSCYSEEAAGPTWARHQPSGLPNARSACVRLQSVFPAQRPAGGSGPYLALLRGEPRGGGSAHRRASRGTSSKSPRFIRHRRRFGDSLPTVVPADSRPLSRPTAGALPRNRLASSATGGASAISPPTNAAAREKPRAAGMVCFFTWPRRPSGPCRP